MFSHDIAYRKQRSAQSVSKYLNVETDKYVLLLQYAVGCFVQFKVSVSMSNVCQRAEYGGYFRDEKIIFRISFSEFRENLRMRLFIDMEKLLGRSSRNE